MKNTKTTTHTHQLKHLYQIKMKIETTPIKDLIIINPSVYEDNRGYFFESYNQRFFREQGIYTNFVQDNQSISVKGVLRGLHFQKIAPQAKLVRCIVGEVYDVVVDLRKSSETYKKWFGVKLSEDNMKMMFVPKGFAHGFVTLSDVAVFHYKCDELYMPSADGGIIYNDPEINIDWGVDVSQLIMSDKDRVLPKLADIETDLGF
jgi:dTDP-4-dehydrorhamnose 3,5-epimerase